MNARARGILCGAGLVLALHGLAGRALAQPKDEETPAAEPVSEPSSGFVAQLGAGGGVGLRRVRVPTSEGERGLSTGLFPALDIDVRAAAVLSEHALLGARFRYQTSIGLVGQETPYGGVARQSPLRAHHIEFGLAPALRFSASPSSVVGGLFAGWSLRALSSELDLSLPDYTLHGPTVRLELAVPFGSDRVVLRLCPELIVWLWASEELRALGALSPAGLAPGGEASLRIALAESVAIELAYRGSYGSIASEPGGSFRDVEHYATVQLAFVY